MHKFLEPLPRIVAHRGDSAFFPENTIPAFQSAAELGVDVIETDVHLTKDGKIVIWHDPTLERNTDGKGRIEDHTYSELLEYDAGYNFTTDGETYPFRGKGVHLALLDEALKACPGMKFNIDLKSKEDEIVTEYIDVIHRNNAEDRVCTASFHLSNLKRLRKAAPDLLTSLSTLEVAPLLLKKKMHLLPSTFERTMIFQVPVRMYGINIIDKSFVDEMHKRNAIVMVWTINEKEEMKRLFSLGVDTIMTDNPRLLINTAKEIQLRK